MPYKIRDDALSDIIKKRKEGVPVSQIQKEYGVCDTTYENTIKRALNLRLLTEEEFNKIYIKRPKLNSKIIKEIVEDRKKGMFKKEIKKNYDISDATFVIAMNKGVELGYLTRKEYVDLTKGFSSRTFEASSKKHGEEKARKLCSDAWSKGMGNNHEALIAAASAGGKKTQEVAPHVLENLKGAEVYGQYQKYTHKGIEFDSKGELWLALMLLECGLVKKIKDGENYQMICGAKVIDFVINNTAIEYHPIPKGLGNHNYKRDRKQELKEQGFNGDVIVIEKENDFFQSGLVKSFFEYVKKRRTVKKKLEKIISIENQLKELNRITEKQERAKDHEVDKELDKEEIISEAKKYDDKVPF